MPLESNITGIQDLNPSWPTGVDPIAEGDDHVRNVKSAVQQSFPGMTAAWTTDQKITCVALDAGSGVISQVGTPVDATDAARKGDVDALDSRITTNTNDIATNTAQIDANSNSIIANTLRLDNLDAKLPSSTSSGNVQANGTILNASPNVTSVLQETTGQYLITFDDPALAGPNAHVVNVTPRVTGGGERNIASVEYVSNTQVRVYFVAAQNGNAVDQSFSFWRAINT